MQIWSLSTWTNMSACRPVSTEGNYSYESSGIIVGGFNEQTDGGESEKWLARQAAGRIGKLFNTEK